MRNQISPEKAARVRKSWSQLCSFGPEAARLFYTRLFDLDPDLKRLFTGSIDEQAEKLMGMITAAVDGLDDPQQIIPMLKELGRQHATYGVRDDDYRVVGSALFWALELSLGDDFTAETKIAWVDFYKLLSDNMRSGV